MSIEQHLHLLQSAAGVHARRIVHSLNLPAHERADVCQDLLVEMIPRFQRFDPGRASAATFIDILARHAAYGVRGRYRQAANRIGHVSLDADPDNAELANITSDVAAQDLAMRVEHAVSTLPRPLRGLVDLLRDGRTSEARRLSRLGHATFYRRLRDIRLHLLAEGLHPAG